MKVLSLFDGMACGAIALTQIHETIDRYVAYEIDKNAIAVATHNFPYIEECGDVFSADFKEYQGFDLLIGGSPCTYWSIAQKNNRETEASGFGWELFCQYVRAWKAVQPKIFLYENNKSMSKEIRKSISETFGFEPIEINSALVSAQNRQRLYWVGIRQANGSYQKAKIEKPEDRHINLQDILDHALAWQEKSYCLTSSYQFGVSPYDTFQKSRRSMAALPVALTEKEMDYMVRPVGNGNHFDFGYIQNGTKEKGKCLTANLSKGIPYNVLCEPINNIGNLLTVKEAIPQIAAKIGYLPEMFNAYNKSEISQKSPTLSTGSMATSSCAVCKFDVSEKPIYVVNNNKITIKGKTYPIKLPDGWYIIRKLSVNECKRLQTVPDWYDMTVISNTQAYRCLGNGWTVEVIMYLLKNAFLQI